MCSFPPGLMVRSKQWQKIKWVTWVSEPDLVCRNSPNVRVLPAWGLSQVCYRFLLSLWTETKEDRKQNEGQPWWHLGPISLLNTFFKRPQRAFAIPKGHLFNTTWPRSWEAEISWSSEASGEMPAWSVVWLHYMLQKNKSWFRETDFTQRPGPITSHSGPGWVSSSLFHLTRVPFSSGH